MKKGDTTIGTFTANSSDNVTITIPDIDITYYTKDEIDVLFNSI